MSLEVDQDDIVLVVESQFKNMLHPLAVSKVCMLNNALLIGIHYDIGKSKIVV